jgi:hypothetical protein
VLLLVQGTVDWSKRGSATASNIFSRNLGSTLGAAVLGSVLNFGLSRFPGVHPDQVRQLLQARTGGGSVDGSLRYALDHSLHLTFWFVLALSLLTVALAMFIPSRHLHELTGGAPAQD